MSYQYTWDEGKRLFNLEKHGLDFLRAREVFEAPMATFEDQRENYGEQRMIGIGLLEANIVVVVYVEIHDNEVRIISMRKAERHEKDIYYKASEYF